MGEQNFASEEQRRLECELKQHSQDIIVLNDQGGGIMNISEDVTHTLRQQMKHHEPIILEPRFLDRPPTIKQNAPTPKTYRGGRQRTSCGVICIEMTSTKNTIVTDEICPTLTSRMGTGGNQVNAVFTTKCGSSNGAKTT